MDLEAEEICNTFEANFKRFQNKSMPLKVDTISELITSAQVNYNKSKVFHINVVWRCLDELKDLLIENRTWFYEQDRFEKKLEDMYYYFDSLQSCPYKDEDRCEEIMMKIIKYKNYIKDNLPNFTSTYINLERLKKKPK